MNMNKYRQWPAASTGQPGCLEKQAAALGRSRGAVQATLRTVVSGSVAAIGMLPMLIPTSARGQCVEEPDLCPTITFDSLAVDTIVTDQFNGVTFSLVEPDDLPDFCANGARFGSCGPNDNYFARVKSFSTTCSGSKALVVDFDAASCEFCPLWLKMVFDEPAKNVSFCMGNQSWGGAAYFRVRAFSTSSGGSPIETQLFENPLGDAGTVSIPVNISRANYDIRRIELDYVDRGSCCLPGGTCEDCSECDTCPFIPECELCNPLCGPSPDGVWTLPGCEAAGGTYIGSADCPGEEVCPAEVEGINGWRIAIDNLAFDAPPINASTQPLVQACEGDFVSLGVTVFEPSPSLSYQWYKNGSPVPGATGDELIIGSVDEADEGQYVVEMSSTCETACSDPAVLQVNDIPAIDPPVANQTACEGGTAIFTVTASGGALEYEWKNPSAVVVGTGPTLVIDPVTVGGAGEYTVQVNNPCGSVGDSATLTVQTAPNIDPLTPTNQNVCLGAEVTYTATASGSPAPTFEWKVNDVVQAETGPSLTFTATLLGTSVISVKALNTCGEDTSNLAFLHVKSGPEIIDDPVSATVLPGAPAAFQVVADTTGAAAYQWRRNAVNLANGPAPGGGTISGANSDTLTLSSVGCGDLGQYDVVITDDCGTTTSADALLDTVLDECPLPGTPYVTRSYELLGDADNIPWSWRIDSDDGAFLNSPDIDVPGVAAGGALAVAQAFADSINAYADGEGCPDESLLASARSVLGTVLLSIRTGCSSPFTLFVGPAGSPADCAVLFGLAACSFNPTIEELPLPGNDCNGNGFDDVVDILAGDSPDENDNGIPDECESCGPCQLHGDVFPTPAGNCTIDVDDILEVLRGFADGPATRPWADIFPCGGNQAIDVDDILSVLRAFAGNYDCPHPCPP